MEAFRSKSEALAYIDSGIVRGQYEDCGKLKVTDSLNMLYGRRHHPYCMAHSLGEREQGYREVPVTYCPPGCHFFIQRVVFEAEQEQRARREGRQRKVNAVAKWLAAAVSAPFRYFKGLPTIVQSLIVILLIIWLFPQFKNTIIEVLKALK